MILTNSAEGQANGVVVSAANSGGGSGNAFTAVTIGSGASLVYSTANAFHGTRSFAATGTNNTATFVTWDGFNDAQIAVRMYYNTGASLPNAAMRYIDIRSATTSLARLSLTSANRLFVQDYNGTNTKWTSTNALAPNTWYRLELAISVSATAATMKSAYYLGDDTTPIQEYSTTTGNTGADNIASVRFISAQGSPWTTTSYFDDMAASSDGGVAFMGPATAGNVPTAPLNVSATPGDGQATITYDAPANNGGSVITGYTATSAPGGLTGTSSGASPTPISVTGLSNGTVYTFTVRAINANGASAASAASNSVTPAGNGGLLRNNAEGQTDGTTLTAANSGAGSGSAFNEVSIGSGANLIFSSAQSAHGSRSYALMGSNGTGTFTAWNTFNDTVMAARIYINLGSTLPGVGLRFIDIRSASTSMARLSIDANNRLFMQDFNGANTKWTSTNALSPNTWYRLELAISMSSTAATMKCAYFVADATTPVQAYSTVSGNTGTSPVTTVRFGSGQSAAWTGTFYFDDVAASNQGGTLFIGPYSTDNKPGKPLNASAEFGNAQAVISYDSPVYGGGLAITGYTATSTPGGLTASVSGLSPSPITISGLSNGTSYTFTVRATSGAGNGPESDPTDSTTPAGLPAAPTAVTATVASGSTSVAFAAPAANGSAITNYTVTSNPGGVTANGTSSPITISGLTNGTAYTFTVTATNAAGTGPASAASNSVTPFTSIRQNNAEGQPHGTALTVANSGGGSGDAFNVVTVGSGASLVYSTASKGHGTRSYALTNAANTATTMSWTGLNDTMIAVRLYYNPGATLPNAAMRLIDIRSATTSMARISLNTSNRLFMQDYNAASTKWTSSASLVANTWYRIEIAISVSATAAIMKCDYYEMDAATTAAAGYSTTTGNTGSDNIAIVNFGTLQNATWTGTAYYDDMGINPGSTTYLGGPTYLTPIADQTVEPWSFVTLDGSQTGISVSSYEWTQLSGPAVTLNGVGAIVTFTAPAVAGGGTMVFNLKIVDSAGVTRNTTMNVTILPPFLSYLSSGGSWTPVKVSTL